MKKLIILFICLLYFSCNKQPVDKCENAHLWDYPEEWRLLPIEQRADALQIPENVLNCLSTEELAKLCLLYPALENLFSFDLLDDGLDELFTEFNGVRELFKRKDAAKYLTERYNKLIQNILNGLPMRSAFYKSEILLSRVEEQDDKILKEILKSLVTGYETIIMLDVEKELFLPYNFFSRAHVIIKISEKYLDDIPLGKNNPVFAPAGADSETADIINQLSYLLIK